MKIVMLDAWCYISDTNFVPTIIQSSLQYEWRNDEGAVMMKSLYIKEEQKFPAGVWSGVQRGLKKQNIAYDFEDQTLYPTGNKELENSIHLRDYQLDGLASFMQGKNDHKVSFRGIESISTGGGKCCNENTIIFTKDGMLPIKYFDQINLEEQQSCATGVFVRTDEPMLDEDVATRIYRDGISESIRVVTSAGYEIIGTPAHKIKVLSPACKLVWKRLDEISETDIVPIFRNIDCFGKNEILREDDAYWLGLLYGDGTLCRTEYLHLCSQDEHILDFARKYLDSRAVDFRENKDERTKNTIHICTGPIYRRRLFSELGIEYQRAETKTWPEIILKSPKNIVAAFIRGLYETDGWIDVKPSICIGLSNERFIKDLQTILLNFGIISHRRSKNTTHLDSHILTIYGKNINKFLDEIGLDPDGPKSEKIESLLFNREGLSHNTNTDLVYNSQQIFTRIFSKINKDTSHYRKMGIKYYTFATYKTTTNNKRNPSIDAAFKIFNYAKNEFDCIDAEELYLVSGAFYFDTIKNIDKIQSNNYDFVIPERKTFIGNGFINHNTVLAAKIIAQINLPTIFFVHTKDLLLQTRRVLTDIFGHEYVGVAGGGLDEYKSKEGEPKQIIVAMIQAFWYHGKKSGFELKPDYKKLLDKTKLMICDECFVEGTQILDNNGIPIKIEKIENYDDIIGGTVTNKFSRTAIDTFTITHQINNLETTDTHPHLAITMNELSVVKEIKAKDLQIGNLLLVPTSIKHSPNLYDILTYNQLRFISTIMCDGHILKDSNMIRVSVSKDSDFFAKVFDDMENDFPRNLKITHTKNTRGDHVTAIASKELKEYFTNTLNVPSGKKSDIITIPNTVWNNTLEDLKGFIDGAFSCEGDIVGNRITLSTTSINFATDIQLLLLKYGILSTIRTKLRKNPNHKTCYFVSVTGENIEKFAETFTLSLQRKQNSINNLLKRQTKMGCSRFKTIKYQNEEYYLSKIKSITKNTNVNKTVYDFTTKSHTFIANNTLTHNCHHSSSDSWFWIAQACPAPYRLGLTATPWRSDGRDLLLNAATGPVGHKVSSAGLVEAGWLSKPDIKLYYVNSKLDDRFDDSTWPNKYKAAIVFNDHRNALIATMAAKRMLENKSVLIIIGHKIHGVIIMTLINRIIANWRENDSNKAENYDRTCQAMIMNSEFDIESRKAALNLFRQGQLKCLIGSLHPNEPIWIKDMAAGQISITHIGEFCERFGFIKTGLYKGQKACEYNDVDIFNKDGSPKFQALTENKDGKVYWENITNVIRHKNTKSVQEITLDNGMITQVTDNHSIINEKGEPTVPKVDGKVKTSHFEIAGYQREIDVIDIITKNSSLVIEDLESIEVIFSGLDRNFIYRLQRVRSGTWNETHNYKTYKRLMPEGIEEPEDLKAFQEEYDKNVWYEKRKFRCKLLNFYNIKYLHKIPHKLQIRRSRSELTLSSKIPITEELMRILGAFAAEGCLCHSTASQFVVTWSCRNDKELDIRPGFKEKSQIRETLKKDIEQVFGVKPYEDSLGLHFRSKLAYALFDGLQIVITKEKRAQKQVPPFIWQCSEKMQKEFLWGYFLGDGSFDHKNNRVKFTSCSYILLCGIRQILINLDCRIVHLNNRSFCERQVQRSWNLAVEDDPFGYCKIKIRNDGGRYKKSLLADNAPIKDIKYLESEQQPKYVYDITVYKTHRFYTASGICLNQTSIYDEGVDLPSVNTVIMAAAGKSETKVIQRLGRSLRLGDRCLYYTANHHCTLLTEDENNPATCVELQKNLENLNIKEAAKHAWWTMNEILGNVKHWDAKEKDIVGSRLICDVNSKEVLRLWNEIIKVGATTDSDLGHICEKLQKRIREEYLELYNELISGAVGQKSIRFFRSAAMLLGIYKNIQINCESRKEKIDVEYIDFYDDCEIHLAEHSTARLHTYEWEGHDPKQGNPEEFIDPNDPEDPVKVTSGNFIDMDDMFKRFPDYFSTDNEKNGIPKIS